MPRRFNRPSLQSMGSLTERLHRLQSPPQPLLPPPTVPSPSPARVTVPRRQPHRHLPSPAPRRLPEAVASRLRHLGLRRTLSQATAKARVPTVHQVCISPRRNRHRRPLYRPLAVAARVTSPNARAKSPPSPRTSLLSSRRHLQPQLRPSPPNRGIALSAPLSAACAAQGPPPTEVSRRSFTRLAASGWLWKAPQ